MDDRAVSARGLRVDARRIIGEGSWGGAFQAPVAASGAVMRTNTAAPRCSTG